MTTNPRTALRTLTATLLLAPVAPLALVAVAPAQAAPARAGVTVTIRAEGTDLSGEVRSSRASCRAEVTVVVVKQKGARGGSDDTRFAMDTTEDDGSWDTGNTGVEGRFYARVKKSPGCAADTSPTIRATRNP